MQNTFRQIIVASTLCGICIGILCGLLWMAISGVNWFGFIMIDLIFLINACLGGIIAALIYSKFRRCPMTLCLYIGNTFPIGIFLFCSFFVADSSTEAWYLFFLTGWLIIATIPAAITSYLIKKPTQ